MQNMFCQKNDGGNVYTFQKFHMPQTLIAIIPQGKEKLETAFYWAIKFNRLKALFLELSIYIFITFIHHYLPRISCNSKVHDKTKM